MYRYKAFWSIPNAGPSVSTFHLENDGASNLQAAADAIRVFFNNRAALLPNEVTVTFDSTVDVLDPSTGTLVGSQPVTSPALVTGSGTGTWAAGSGVRLDWLTDGFLAGRRVKGRTFLVPAVGGAFGTDGRVLQTQVAATNGSAGTLISALAANSTALGIWARPFDGSSEAPPRAGSFHVVTGASASSLAATLRGRKY